MDILIYEWYEYTNPAKDYKYTNDCEYDEKFLISNKMSDYQIKK